MHETYKINRKKQIVFLEVPWTGCLLRNVGSSHWNLFPKIYRFYFLQLAIWSKGRFNNCVTLKVPFLTHLPPTITLCHVYSREEPSCVKSRSAQTHTPAPFPTKNEILGFKKVKSRSKEISFLFHMIFFSTKYQQHKKHHMFKKQNTSLLSVACPNWFCTI